MNNMHGLAVEEILKSKFGKLVNVLGCGIGKDFDINKLKWNKVIICSDADIDGNNITSLICCFFLIFLRPLVEAGLIYKALPPLYLIDTKHIKKFYRGDKWLFDKNEYYDLFNVLVANNVEIAISTYGAKDNEVINLTGKGKLDWMQLNEEYLLELDSMVKKTACNPLILEYVCAYKLLHLNDETKFKLAIEKEFEELTYDMNEQVLLGSYKGEFVSLIIDKLFMKVCKRFINLLSKNPGFILYCKNKNSNDDGFGKMTIGGFLSLMGTQFNIPIDQRYKGLSEAQPTVLFTTTVNPKTRRLIRLTIDDLQKAIDIFEVLHGRDNSMREKRRELLENSNFKLSDIDS
jgi:DNA gyrase/topoisomerase IV subunit B